ncbi:phage holin family protein [Sinomicrobium pectinilyticum]|uniref:Phage holin family protein n=1 Tax=Sinomicrobium pectinilyticum TaxID=1084421 RepID=A0A3N0E7D0_SINP1|nr:phage holin family protein [Sinomicrobium pectinilyticum]RNL83746.1 phage holin family protein [Sinomicrobium pectinilyticum]
MNVLLRVLLTALAVVVIAQILPGVSVDSYLTAVLVAVVLALLNLLVKPILIILTLPITIITLGLFLLLINAVVILITDSLVGGFHVTNIWWALLFSLLLSFLQSILHSFLKENTDRTR